MDKWRKSFQASTSSLKEQVVETGIEEISLLSDGFFEDLKDEEQDFDFDLEGISEIDQESLFENTSRYESVQNCYMYVKSTYFTLFFFT